MLYRFVSVAGTSVGFGQQALPLTVAVKFAALACASHGSPSMLNAAPARLMARYRPPAPATLVAVCVLVAVLVGVRAGVWVLVDVRVAVPVGVRVGVWVLVGTGC